MVLTDSKDITKKQNITIDWDQYWHAATKQAEELSTQLKNKGIEHLIGLELEFRINPLRPPTSTEVLAITELRNKIIETQRFTMGLDNTQTCAEITNLYDCDIRLMFFIWLVEVSELRDYFIQLNRNNRDSTSMGYLDACPTNVEIKTRPMHITDLIKFLKLMSHYQDDLWYHTCMDAIFPQINISVTSDKHSHEECLLASLKAICDNHSLSLDVLQTNYLIIPSMRSRLHYVLSSEVVCIWHARDRYLENKSFPCNEMKLSAFFLSAPHSYLAVLKQIIVLLDEPVNKIRANVIKDKYFTIQIALSDQRNDILYSFEKELIQRTNWRYNPKDDNYIIFEPHITPWNTHLFYGYLFSNDPQPANILHSLLRDLLADLTITATGSGGKWSIKSHFIPRSDREQIIHQKWLDMLAMISVTGVLPSYHIEIINQPEEIKMYDQDKDKFVLAKQLFYLSLYLNQLILPPGSQGKTRQTTTLSELMRHDIEELETQLAEIERIIFTREWPPHEVLTLKRPDNTIDDTYAEQDDMIDLRLARDMRICSIQPATAQAQQVIN